MFNFRWFNVSFPRGKSIKLWNLFNRRSKDGHFWGFGILQVRSRHLFYIGHSGISILFVGQPAHHDILAVQIDDLYRRLAWCLPRRVVYWAAIRLTSAATVGDFADTVPSDLRMFDALNRWSDK